MVKAQKELDDAELRLSYTEIRAPVSGFVNRRAVNPGDHVQAGQGLLSIQPLDEVYIEANFKETQLADLTIGQPVEISVDAYPGRVFRGRVSGFAPATGRRLVDAAAGERHGQLRQGRAAHPGADRPDRAQPARDAAAGRHVGRARGRHQGRRRPARTPAAGSAALAGQSCSTRRPTDESRTPCRPSARPAINPWVIALTVTLATFMEVLDTSIANVALPHIAGSLSVSVHESTWVLTSYLVANAVILPLSGWLSSILGRKRFYMTCVVLFTISSALCGMATSIEQLVFFRVLQGLAGGGLQPSEQAILMDTFPPAKRGMAMAVYTLAILVAPVLGPTLGGYITENYSWRWIFYINLPVGVISVILSSLLLQDPPYLKAQRAARKGQPFRIDFIGLGLLSIGLASLELMLDKGQEHDWFDSPFIVWLCVDRRRSPWSRRSSGSCGTPRRSSTCGCSATATSRPPRSASSVAFGVLYGSNVLLPQMLQTLMGYSALKAGLVLSPAGFVTMLEMPVIGILLSRGRRRAEDDHRRTR